MKKLIAPRVVSISITLIMYLGVSLYSATLTLDEERHQSGQYSFKRHIETGQALIEFTGPHCTISRTYNQCTATKTVIKSTRTISCETMKELTQMIQGIDNIHLHQQATMPSHPVNAASPQYHKGRLIYNLIDEGRDMVRDCIEMLPRPIGYFLSFWPIRPVLNSLFPKR